MFGKHGIFNHLTQCHQYNISQDVKNKLNKLEGPEFFQSLWDIIDQLVL